MSLKPPEAHLGHLVLRENKAIRLARVPVNGDRWQDSLILHPRYVPKEVEHEIFIARVYRRGRTVDLFLDEPITVDSVAYGILNFKGVGANADRPLVIQPDDWWGNQTWGWIPRKNGDPYGRVWGAMTKGKSRREYPARLFHEYGIVHAPHLALNQIPSEITRYIRRSEHGTERHNLVQLVRGLQTNIRFDNYSLLTPEQEQTIDLEGIAREDAKLINTQFALARKGKMLGFMGRFSENRYIDGKYTDAENLYSGELVWCDAVHFLTNIIDSFIESFKVYNARLKYYQELEHGTGFAFTSLRGDFTAQRLLLQELEKATEGKYKADYSQTGF